MRGLWSESIRIIIDEKRMSAEIVVNRICECAEQIRRSNSASNVKSNSEECDKNSMKHKYFRWIIPLSSLLLMAGC